MCMCMCVCVFLLFSILFTCFISMQTLLRVQRSSNCYKRIFLPTPVLICVNAHSGTQLDFLISSYLFLLPLENNLFLFFRLTFNFHWLFSFWWGVIIVFFKRFFSPFCAFFVCC
uniref:Uncharacterized protein n=1 Tax=Trypanosoma congolense (strain IL3000) TaxID=1068625 RepID=G0US45_TRYCI|nr:hypothetical protein, unlikely [Trypanosoma congolense IL3000]